MSKILSDEKSGPQEKQSSIAIGGELSDDALDSVSGGTLTIPKGVEVIDYIAPGSLITPAV